MDQDGRLNPEEVAELKKQGIECHDGIPIFPFTPDSIKESRFRVIEAGDLRDDREIQRLVDLLWREPETDIYYYMGHTGGPPADSVLMAARHRGEVLMDIMERRYYRYPKNKRDYLRIEAKADGSYAWPWQKDVVEKGPEFWQVTLKLSQRKRDELDAWRKVQLEEHFREQARKAKYEYDVFLSYAAADQAAAQEVHDKIMAANRKVFMAPKSIEPGEDFAEKIRLALHGARELWLVVSPSSAKSEWVTTEWGAAWALGKRIVPILFRCAPETLPSRLARLQCVDVHRCQEVVDQLVRATPRP